ncbi:cytochrome P450 [Candidatus Poriferisocius sp.]|uniref:cytochrome P450 n=1 Tax=Candidatus Poriferisocius sp. TaxID=3101276 RepID=UPI003B52EDFA
MSDELIIRLVTDPRVIADPYPLLAELRETSPVHKLSFADYWVLTRYDDCRMALRDPRMGNAEPGDEVPTLTAERVRTPQEERTFLFLNPPDHTRLRSLVSRAFTPRRVEGLRSAVEEMTAELLDSLAASGGGDLIEELAFPLPANVISELVGVPRADRDWLRPLVSDLAGTLEPNRSQADLDRAETSAVKVDGYFNDLIDQRRAEPSDDLLSALIAASDGEDRLTQREIGLTLSLIYAAGFETTTNLIGNMVHTLMHHPDQLARLRAARSLVPGAVDEVLRYQPPVQVDARYTFEEVEIGGHSIAKGSMVMTLLAAANRDPSVIDDPDRFDITRQDAPLLSFGSGIHYCLGTSLARLEGQVVLAGLLDRFGTWTPLEDDPPWKDRLTLRGLARLPVALS